MRVMLVGSVSGVLIVVLLCSCAVPMLAEVAVPVARRPSKLLGGAWARDRWIVRARDGHDELDAQARARRRTHAERGTERFRAAFQARQAVPVARQRLV